MDPKLDSDLEPGAKKSRTDPGPSADSLPQPTTLRDLLPSKMADKWIKGGIADRPLDFAELLERSQLMTSQAASLLVLNDIFTEMGLTPASHLRDAIDRAQASGILQAPEAHALRDLNRRANSAKHQHGSSSSA